MTQERSKGWSAEIEHAEQSYLGRIIVYELVFDLWVEGEATEDDYLEAKDNLFLPMKKGLKFLLNTYPHYLRGLKNYFLKLMQQHLKKNKG